MEQVKRQSIFAQLFGINEGVTKSDNLFELSDKEKQKVSKKDMELLIEVEGNKNREKNVSGGFNSNAGAAGGTSKVEINSETEAQMREQHDKFVASQETKKVERQTRKTKQQKQQEDMEIGG